MSLYKNILKQAFQITWRNKYLWFFGLFAALLGNGGEYEILIKGLSGYDKGELFFSDLYRIYETGFFSTGTLQNIIHLIKNDTLTILTVLFIGLIFLILFGFLVWLTIVSQIALVNNSAGVITKKKKDFKDGVAVGVKNFWPVVTLNIIIKLIIYIAFAFISLPIAFAIAETGQTGLFGINLLFVVLFMIFIPVAISLSLMIKYAIVYVVIKGNTFMEAIKNGWALFVSNWLISIEMAFVLFFINILVGIGIMMFILILAIPLIFLAILFFKLASVAGFWFIIFLGLTLVILSIVLGGSMLASFQISAWTGLFIELVGKGGMSKIQRIFSRD